MKHQSNPNRQRAIRPPMPPQPWSEPSLSLGLRKQKVKVISSFSQRQQQEEIKEVFLVKAENPQRAYRTVRRRQGRRNITFCYVLNRVFAAPHSDGLVFEKPQRPEEVAIHSISKRKDRNNNEDYDDGALRDILVKQELGDDKNIQRCHEALMDDDNMYVVTSSHRKATTLSDMIPLTDEQAARMVFRQIVKNVRSVHNNGICHVNLSPDTIHITGQQPGGNHTVLTDFKRCLKIPMSQDGQVTHLIARLSKPVLHTEEEENELYRMKRRMSLDDILRRQDTNMTNETYETYITSDNTSALSGIGLSDSLLDSVNVESHQPHHESLQSVDAPEVMYGDAPEMYHNLPVFDGQATDIWSMGVMLFKILTGKYMFDVPDRSDICYHHFILCRAIVFDDDNLSNDQRVLQEEGGPKLWALQERIIDVRNLNPLVRDLLSGMLQPNYEERYTLEDVQKHPWVMTNKTTTMKKGLQQQPVFGQCRILHSCLFGEALQETA